MNYNEFIAAKAKPSESHGFTVSANALNPNLFDFQRDIVKWALAKGRAAIFADCGLGKTLMQLSWAYEVYLHAGGSVLILAPLAVAAQTQAEGERFGIPVKICESSDDVAEGVNITNYEKLGRFDTAKWRLKGHAERTFWEWMASWAVVLDNPASLGYEGEGYDLQGLHVHEIVVDKTGEDVPSLSLMERRRESTTYNPTILMRLPTWAEMEVS